eukprot:6462933-Amphidinium_carterae.2
MNPAAGSGLDGFVQFQQGAQLLGQLLPQYSNPDLPLGMFPQAIEQRIDQMQANNESLLWHGPAPPYPIITPPTHEEVITPNQETLLWPGHAVQPFAVPPAQGSDNPWPGESLLWPSHATEPYPVITPPSNWERDIGEIYSSSDSYLQILRLHVYLSVQEGEGLGWVYCCSRSCETRLSFTAWKMALLQLLSRVSRSISAHDDCDAGHIMPAGLSLFYKRLLGTCLLVLLS